jgi:hypothetical protein
MVKGHGLIHSIWAMEKKYILPQKIDTTVHTENKI